LRLGADGNNKKGGAMMARQRTIPFGYAIQNGELVVNPVEAEAVRRIYDSYINGSSYLDIAKAMTAGGAPYHEDKTAWDKNMVKRVLENERFLGTDIWPEIVSQEQFFRAQEIRQSKTSNHRKEPECNAAVKKKFVCGVCGAPFSRSPASDYDKRWWHCGNEGCVNVLKTTDGDLEQRVIALLNRIISHPELLDRKLPAPPPSLEAERLKNEINRELSKPEFDEECCKSLIFSHAAERYKSLGNVDAVAKTVAAMKNRITHMKKLTAFDSEFFNAVTESLIVGSDGSFTLRTINGTDIFERGVCSDDNN
jgi:hypothetical protein